MTITEIFQISGAMIVSSGLAGSVIFGLSKYLGRIWADRILAKEKQAIDEELLRLQTQGSIALEAIRGQNAKHSITHQVQFTKEFDLYTKLWVALGAFVEVSVSLRGNLEFDTIPAVDIQRQEKKREAFFNAYDQFIKIVEESKPFYPANVYDAISDLLKFGRTEFHSYRTNGRNYKSTEEIEFFGKVREDIKKKADEICGQIRTRIGIIGVA